MRDISKCYRKLKEDRDLVEHVCVINHQATTGFYLNGFSFHYMKYESKVKLNRKNETNDCKVGDIAWTYCLYRRVKP